MKTTLAFIVPFAAVSAALGTPSGLNNIPTADTTPQGTFVLQAFSTTGGDGDTDFNIGFKTGIDFLKVVKLEVGADSHILPGNGGPVVISGKVALPFGQGLPTFALGAANVAFSEQQRQRAGDVFGYAVLSQDFGWFRAHAGCAYQDADALPFFGLDKTFRVSKPRRRRRRAPVPHRRTRVVPDRARSPTRSVRASPCGSRCGRSSAGHPSRGTGTQSEAQPPASATAGSPAGAADRWSTALVGVMVSPSSETMAVPSTMSE